MPSSPKQSSSSPKQSSPSPSTSTTSHQPSHKKPAHHTVPQRVRVGQRWVHFFMVIMLGGLSFLFLISIRTQLEAARIMSKRSVSTFGLSNLFIPEYVASGVRKLLLGGTSVKQAVSNASNHYLDMDVSILNENNLLFANLLMICIIPTIVVFGYWNWLSKEYVRYA